MKGRAFLLSLLLGTLTACTTVPPLPIQRPAPFSIAGGTTGTGGTTEVSYSFKTHDGQLMAARLTLPASVSGRVPVAIFIGGSGTWDSNYFQWTSENKPNFVLPIRGLARQAAQAGIAFIRYQKRGTSDPGGQPTEQWKTAQLDNLLADTRTLLAKVKADPRLDGSRIALIGHSEGTMLSTWVGGTDPDVKGFVMLGLVRRNLKDVYRSQLVTHNGGVFFAKADIQPTDGFLDTAEIEKAKAKGMRFDKWQSFDQDHDSRLSKAEYLALLGSYYDEWVRNIEQAKPEVLVPGNWSPAGWFQQHYRHPTVGEAWQSIQTPVLVLQGKWDINTPVTTESEPFEAMLTARHHPDHRLVEFEGLDHTFRDASGVSHADKPFELIVPWLRQHLGGC
ncbi:MAG TPA: alpha/beta fold hydrolase [Stenomitos sp.]